MKTSGIFRIFTATSHNVTSQMLCHLGEKAIIAQKRDKNEHSRYLGRKLDDSLPDFVTFVVSRFWNWGKETTIRISS
ncbi:hypothetical protein IVU49_23845 [Salmonella enterica subsp. enterica serovar Worthington]|nr:hypothetical protein [Salmonella enterica subsp. enterica serovar Worthington]